MRVAAILRLYASAEDSTIASDELVQECSLMFGFRSGTKGLALLFVVAMAAVAIAPASAQTARRTRRESNANRRARIARAVEETYSKRYEFAGGGGYLRFRSGENLQKNNEVTFFVSGTRFLNRKLGITGDVHGAYGNAKIGNNIFNIRNPQISEYTFTGGPTYRFYAQQHSSLSAFITGGVAYGKFDSGSKAIPPELIGIWPAQWRPAFTAGVNFDYNFYPDLAIRFTPTYIGTTFGGTVQNNLGLNIGLVYRFGRPH